MFQIVCVSSWYYIGVCWLRNLFCFIYENFYFLFILLIYLNCEYSFVVICVRV